MELETKVRIAKASLTALTAVVSLFLLGLLVIVLCAGLDINPFRETTTSFLMAAFAGLIGLAAVLVLLNVAVNISLIADAKIAELKPDSRQGWPRHWLIAYVAAALVLVGVVFGGTYFSKARYLNVVQGQADEVLRNNKNLLDETGQLLASGKKQDYRRLVEIRGFLEHQRSDLPNLTLIYSGNFADKLALYQLNSYVPDDEKSAYAPLYFACTQHLDCDYLKKFFSGEKVDVLREYTVRNDQFYIYIPVTGSGSRFVLLFDRTNHYGKLGS